MEEELNEHDLEERLYAMLHHVDETATNATSEQDNGLNIVDNAPRSTVRRYWRTSEPSTPFQKTNTPFEKSNTPFQKSNTPKLPAATNKPTVVNKTNQQTKPKEEKSKSPVPPAPDLSIFQSTTPQNYRKSIEIIDHDITTEVCLESSDEDEVIEVAIPPKPTITIESSDEDELVIVQPDSVSKEVKVNAGKAPQSHQRDVSASPVPSVVSSISDEFIRGDCIALNISSRQPDNPSFDFSLHGSDLLVQSTPVKKKKKKKFKEAVTSTPLVTANTTPVKTSSNDVCFATPKSKAKNKKQKSLNPIVAEKCISNADAYDSDSNHSVDIVNNKSYTVSDKSLPSTDVYESDSNLSEVIEQPKQKQNNDSFGSDISTSPDKTSDETLKTSHKNNSSQMNKSSETVSFVDLTHNYITVDRVEDSDIQESIVMGNVSGFPENEEYGDDFPVYMSDSSKFGSTKIPAILNEDLDFDNLKGKDKVCKRRRYSLSALRAEMEKFYNESWGGENFNHREIQKSMSRDKSLWVIDPKDKMPPLNKKKVTCNYCNRAGHRDDTCRMKPPVCYMCGSTGHFEPRCPRKICVNCGSPNQMYSSMCRNCCHWNSLICGECGQRGHPASHCPDMWRRYHSTIDNNVPLERCQPKKPHQLYCSGCTRRGHLVHACRIAIPFSGLPVYSPYVYLYRPVYPPTPSAPNISQAKNAIAPAPPRPDRNKRQSKSPTAHDSHLNKKRNVSAGDESDVRRNTKSPVNVKNTPQRQSIGESRKEPKNNSDKDQSRSADDAMDFIPIHSANHDKKGNIIQDNEVSDTSDLVTSARIYVTNDIISKLKTPDGEKWLKDTSEEHNVSVEHAEVSSFLSIKGLLGDQEAFQAKLRDWVQPVPSQTGASANDVTPNNTDNSEVKLIPKNRNNLLRQLNNALESLKEDLGDPRAIYKDIKFLQNRQDKLLKQKVINPKVLNFNRTNLNLQLQKLNMVLVGQAGLAGGRQHLDELYSLQEKLKNSRQKNITSEMQTEIRQHYSSIFSPIHRADYLDLLKMYRPASLTKKKKKKKALKLNPKINRLKKPQGSPAQQTPQHGENIVSNMDNDGKVTNNKNHQKMTRNLIYYHRKLSHTWVIGGAQKKKRAALLRRLHSFIGSLSKKEDMSSKMYKKMQRTQEQTQMFLVDV